MTVLPQTALDPSPHAEYARRRQARHRSAQSLAGWEVRLGMARVFAVAAALALLVAAFNTPSVRMWWAVLPTAAFVALVMVHDRVTARLRRARRSVRYYDDGIARLEHRWMGVGDDGTRFIDSSHLYASDLDIVGYGSLFQLVNAARTQTGEWTLARWLLEPAALPVVRSRQAAVDELRGRLDTREELALLGEDVRAGVDPAAVKEWSAARELTTAPGVRAVAAGLAILNTLTFIAWWLLGSSPIPFAALVAASIAYSWTFRRAAGRVITGVEGLRSDVELMAGMLARIEAEEVASPHLAALAHRLVHGSFRASGAARRLNLLADLLFARKSLLFTLPAAVLLWGTQLAFAAEAWRRKHGEDMATWLDVIGEFEALSCLAAYAYERPGDPFPELVDDGPLFEAYGLGHPLIPAVRRVVNDLTLNAQTSVMIVSGSNMSGKSTLLRTVGTNAVLALAGAPVCATRLRLSPLAIGASIAIRDSLVDDTSHFYAELLRLRGIVDLTSRELSVIFLVDEILHGTNSHDRHAGTESVLRRLIGDGAIGLATTHDLGLGDLALELAPKVANVHFQDDVVDGRMAFDYKLRSGVVKRSNALRLMRSLGLID